jgi:probable HAF family extracellular repeat protein
MKHHSIARILKAAMPMLIVCVVLTLNSADAAQAQKPYATIDYPNSNHTELTAISPSGDIVGRYVSSDGANHGFLYSKGKFTSIDYPGAVGTDATYINPRGDVVGGYTNSNNEGHAYLWSKGNFSTLMYLGVTVAYGISPSGDIVGPYSTGGPLHGYLLSKGNFSQIPDYPGASDTVATMMAGDVIIGGAGNLNNDQTVHGFMLKNGSFTLVDFPASPWVFISGLNPVGEIVGGHGDANGVEHGFLYSRGAYIAIDFPEWTSSYANGIDPQGDIVGRYTDAQGTYHGYFLPHQNRPTK